MTFICEVFRYIHSASIRKHCLKASMLENIQGKNTNIHRAKMRAHAVYLRVQCPLLSVELILSDVGSLGNFDWPKQYICIDPRRKLSRDRGCNSSRLCPMHLSYCKRLSLNQSPPLAVTCAGSCVSTRRRIWSANQQKHCEIFLLILSEVYIGIWYVVL